MATIQIKLKAVAEITIEVEAEDGDEALDVGCALIHKQIGEAFWKDFDIDDFTLSDFKVELVEPEPT